MKIRFLPFMFIFLSAPEHCLSDEKKTPPHIIVIVIDDLGN